MPVENVTTRAALAALAAPTGKTSFLAEDGREGLFEFRTGNFTSQVAADPLQGLFVASSVVAVSSGCWVRIWDEVYGRPEWFGAVTNSGTANCLPALEACVSLCPVTLLGSKDYWITSTWKIDQSYRTIKADVNSDSYNTGHGARIVCTDPSKDVVQIGPSVMPSGGTSTFTRNMKVEGFAVLHSAGVNPPAVGQEANGVCGFRVQYVLNLEADNLISSENIIGFRCYGIVASWFTKCNAFRSLNALSGSSPDLFFGWYLQGTPSILSGGGGNASVYFDRCSVTVGNSPALPGGSIGFYAVGNFVDTFVRDFETSALRKGVVLDGQDWNGTGKTTQVDFLLENPVLDTCAQRGIEIINTNRSCQIEISNPYVALLPGGTAGMWINQTGGQIRIQGGRMIGYGDAPAIFISQTSGVEVDGCSISNYGGTVCYVEYSKNFRISPSINNQDYTSSSAAVYIRDSKFGHVAPSVKGKANAFPQGIYLLYANNDKIVIDPTLVDASCVSGGATNKLQINGTSIVSPGYYTSSGSAGAVGAGISVTGITA